MTTPINPDDGDSSTSAKKATLNRRYIAIIAACFVIAIGIGAVVVNQTSLLSDSRTQLSQQDFAAAYKSADSVIVPPFSIEASRLRGQIRDAETRAQRSRAAQAQLDKIEAALSAIDSAQASYAAHATAYDSDEADARSAGQRRHDEAESADSSLEFNLREAKIEQSKVQAMSSEVEGMVSALRDAAAQFEPFFSREDTRKLDDSIETASTQMNDCVSSWIDAVTPIVDNDTIRENGRFDFADTSQIAQFYAKAEEDENAGHTALTTATAEIERLNNLLEGQAGTEKAQIGV